MSSTPNVFIGDPTEFSGVASRYSPMLFRVALRRLRNAEDAEDAVQDALLSAYKHISQFEGRSQLSSWLVRIVINAASMKLRRRTRYEAVSIDQGPESGEATLANGLIDAGPDPETICSQAEMVERLHTALDHISPNLRTAFHMREILEFSTKETANALRITTSSVKSRVRRARSAVRLHLDQGNSRRLADRFLAKKLRSEGGMPRVNSRSIQYGRGAAHSESKQKTRDLPK